MTDQLTYPQIVTALQGLRIEIEHDGLTEAQVFLLTDVCQVLGLDDRASATVVGQPAFDLVTRPVSLRLNGRTQPAA